MPDDSPTAKLRTLDHVDGDIPVVRKAKQREPSGSLSRAAVHLLDEALSKHLGTKVDESVKEAAAEMLEALALNAREEGERAGKGKLSVPWIMVIVLSLVLAGGVVALTWQRLRTLEGRQDEVDTYNQVVAHHLVLTADTNYTNAEHQDTLTRRIAVRLGIPTEDIPKPEKIHPPPMVQRKNNDLEILRGDTQ